MEQSELSKALRGILEDEKMSQVALSDCSGMSTALIGQHLDVSKTISERTAVNVLAAMGYEMKFVRDPYGNPIIIFPKKNQEKT